MIDISNESYKWMVQYPNLADTIKAIILGGIERYAGKEFNCKIRRFGKGIALSMTSGEFTSVHWNDPDRMDISRFGDCEDMGFRAFKGFFEPLGEE